MTTIIAPRRIADNFGDGFSKLFPIVEQIRQIPTGEAICIDMRECLFLTPFFLLPIFLFLRKESERRLINIQTKEGDYNFTGYLKFIFFTAGFTGFDPEVYGTDNYSILLETYSRKTYIPIINFPASRRDNNTDVRDHILGCVNNILVKQLNLKGANMTGVMYLIDEAINNIVDHSGEERGFMFAQYFPTNGYVDICIGDSGRGILGSYRHAGFADIVTHKDAIISAANGLSTKNRPGAEGRGFGISTSLDMLVNGLKGKYFLMSGNAFLFKNVTEEVVTTVSDNLHLNGSLVALRIPYYVQPDFNPTKYFG